MTAGLQLEVLDPATGRVVARADLPQAGVRFVPGSHRISVMRQDSLGYVFIDLFTPALEADSATPSPGL